MPRRDAQSKKSSKFKFPLAKPKLGKKEREFLLEAFDSGWISSSGEFIKTFEKEFPNYIGQKFGIATSNGTVAIHLALVALGIGQGDEVIVPDLTFVAPANMVALTGAKPILADSNPKYWGVDAATIKERLTPKTKAVIVVHLYGHPVDLGPIIELCESRNIALIEDCAEAHGAEYRSKKVGGFGRISCFSFYGNKLLTTGEGGMCLTNDSSLEQRMKLLRDHGADRTKHFWHPISGFNYRMTNLQAAIGCAQLQTLNMRLDHYRAIGQEYTKQLTNLFGDNVIPHPEMNWAKCVFWMYTCLLNDLDIARRDSLQSYLLEQGIETRPMFYPISKLPMYSNQNTRNSVAESLSKRGISLPTYDGLSRDAVSKICNAISDFFYHH